MENLGNEDFSSNGWKPIVMRVRAHGIVETMNVTEQCILKLRKRAIGAAVRLLMLEISEKAFHHSIIVRIAFGRKRLDHSMLIQKLPESLCCKLTAPIRMKHHAGRHASCSNSIFQSGNGKIGIDVCRQAECYDSA